MVETTTGRVEQKEGRTWWPSQRESNPQFDVVANLKRAEQEKGAKPAQLDRFPPGETGLHVYRSTWTPDGKRMALFRKVIIPAGPSSSEITLRVQIEIWNAETQQSTFQWSIGRAESAQWASDSRRLAVAGTGQLVHKLQLGTERNAASAIAWNPTGTRLVAGNDNIFVRKFTWPETRTTGPCRLYSNCGIVTVEY